MKCFIQKICNGETKTIPCGCLCGLLQFSCGSRRSRAAPRKYVMEKKTTTNTKTIRKSLPPSSREPAHRPDGRKNFNKGTPAHENQCAFGKKASQAKLWPRATVILTGLTLKLGKQSGLLSNFRNFLEVEWGTRNHIFHFEIYD